MRKLKSAADFCLDKAFQLYSKSPLVRLNVIGAVYDKVVRTLPQFAAIYPGLGDLRIVKWGDNVIMSDGVSVLALKNNYARMILRERKSWERFYRVDLHGKTVLDIGAGCGESAWFFFKQGAKKVVAVESDKRCIPFLKINRDTNRWAMDIISARFSLQHLSIPHDFVKIDVEGAELILLDSPVKELGPCRVELHPTIIGEESAKRIEEEFGLVRIDTEYTRSRSGIYGNRQPGGTKSEPEVTLT